MYAREPVRYLDEEEFAAAKAANLANHVLCRQNNGECWGYHCGKCGASVGMMGHDDACRIRPLGSLEQVAYPPDFLASRSKESTEARRRLTTSRSEADPRG